MEGADEGAAFDGGASVGSANAALQGDGAAPGYRPDVPLQIGEADGIGRGGEGEFFAAVEVERATDGDLRSVHVERRSGKRDAVRVAGDPGLEVGCSDLEHPLLLRLAGIVLSI